MASKSVMVHTIPPNVMETLQHIAGHPTRWHVTVPKMLSRERLEFGQLVVGHSVKKVWIDRHEDGDYIAVCVNW